MHVIMDGDEVVFFFQIVPRAIRSEKLVSD